MWQRRRSGGGALTLTLITQTLTLTGGAKGELAVEAIGRSQIFKQAVFDKAAEIVGRIKLMPPQELLAFTKLTQRAADVQRAAEVDPPAPFSLKAVSAQSTNHQ